MQKSRGRTLLSSRLARPLQPRFLVMLLQQNVMAQIADGPYINQA